MKISASIYSDPDRPLKEVVYDLQKLGIDILHADCRDRPEVFEDIARIREWTSLPIDLHLITNSPEKYYDLIAANKVEWVTLQYEELPADYRIPADLHCTWGLSIVSTTPITAFSSYEASCSFILFMTTTPGLSGGTFDDRTFSRIREFESKFPAKRIHVDGGVNDEISFILRNMGVSCAVSGTYLLKARDMDHAMLRLKTSLKKTGYCVRDFMMRRNEIPIARLDELCHPKDVFTLISRKKTGFCYITDKTERLIGVITDGDLRRGVLKFYDKMQDLTVEDLLNKSPVVVRDEQTLQDMMNLAKSRTNPLLHIPVVNSTGQLVGGISFKNLIKGEL